MKKYLEEILFGLVAVFFIGTLFYGASMAADLNAAPPVHHYEMSDSMEVHNAEANAVAAATSVQEVSAVDSLNLVAPASLGIANHQKRTVPFPAIREVTFMDGGNTISISCLNEKLKGPESPKLLYILLAERANLNFTQKTARLLTLT
jgi:hypothetical protein